MYTVSSSDGRVTFTYAPEDNHSLAIQLPTGVVLKLASIDVETLYTLLDAIPNVV